MVGRQQRKSECSVPVKSLCNADEMSGYELLLIQVFGVESYIENLFFYHW
jgi:hypothetical protein